MQVETRWKPNKVLESKKCYGTSSLEHPGTLMIATERGSHYCGGKITGLNVPEREFPCKCKYEYAMQCVEYCVFGVLKAVYPIFYIFYPISSIMLQWSAWNYEV